MTDKIRAALVAYRELAVTKLAIRDATEALREYDARATPALPHGEPVAYQYRMRASWSDLWTNWEYCSKGSFDDYNRVPINGDWHYEARALYEHPQALPQGVEDFISDRGIRDESWYGSECVERTYILADDFREFARASLQKESEPVAHVVTHAAGGNAGLAKHIHWLPHGQSVMPGDLLYLHPKAPPEGMALVPAETVKDAERYRFIRMKIGYDRHGVTLPCGNTKGRPEETDAAIDAAMLAAAKEKGE